VVPLDEFRQYPIDHYPEGTRWTRLVRGFPEKNTQDCRDCEKASTLAGELIAMIRVNALRGTFATATFEEIEDHLKPWIARLMGIRHPAIIPAIRETNVQSEPRHE
jgi:hypothetical protein